MPAPQQSKNPVYKETSGISRPRTDYAKFSARNHPGTALARLLGAIGDVSEDAMREQKEEALKKGRELAMLQVPRENVLEAHGGGFSQGWTMEGFDTQRGIEDAYIHAQTLMDDYKNSGLANTDDPEAWRQFIHGARDKLLGQIDGSTDFYKDGYQSALADAFQNIGRAHARNVAQFRDIKKTQAFRAHVGQVIDAEGPEAAKAVTEAAEKQHGISKKAGRDIEAEEIIRRIEQGTLDPSTVDMRRFPKRSQEAITEAAERRREAERADRGLNEASKAKALREAERAARSARDPEERQKAIQEVQKLSPERANEIAMGLADQLAQSPNASQRSAARTLYSNPMLTEDMVDAAAANGTVHPEDVPELYARAKAYRRATPTSTAVVKSAIVSREFPGQEDEARDTFNEVYTGLIADLPEIDNASEFAKMRDEAAERAADMTRELMGGQAMEEQDEPTASRSRDLSELNNAARKASQNAND